jgi:hypothetical protein
MPLINNDLIEWLSGGLARSRAVEALFDEVRKKVKNGS